MTKNPGVQIEKSYLLIRRLTHHAVYNINITGVIVLSNEMIIDIIIMRAWHAISSLILFFKRGQWPVNFNLHFAELHIGCSI